MSAWFRQHFYAIGHAFAQLRQAPGNFIFNTIVLAMTLSLPFLGITLLDNAQAVTRQMAVEPEISIFLSMDASRSQAQALGESLKKMLKTDGQDTVIEFIPKEQALENLKRSTGIQNIINTLGSNPLPDAYIIRLENRAERFNIATRTDALLTQIKKLPHVQKVQIDSDWIRRLSALLSVLRMGVLFLGVTLGIVVVAVIFNTIRLQVVTHLDEIRLSRLVGASRSYIRRPFYYMGILLGVSSSLLALGIVYASLFPFNSTIESLARLYGSHVQLEPVYWTLAGMLVFFTAILGWIAAILSVNRQLSRFA